MNATNANLNQPPTNPASGSYLPESAETYFRWGIPSLVLATVTIILALYNTVWVQPNLYSNYRAFCDKQIALLNVAPFSQAPSSNAIPLSAVTEAELDSTAMLKRISDLERLELALKRLVLWNKEDAITRYQLARTSVALSNACLNLVRSSNVDERELQAPWLAKANNSLSRATDAMRAVTRLRKEFALEANVWLIDQKISSSNSTIDELRQLESELEQLQKEHTPNDDFYLSLATIQWKQATHPSLILDEVRDSAAKRSQETTRLSSEPSLRNAILNAQSTLLIAPAEARTLAQSIIDQQGVNMTQEPPTADLVLTLYKSLLITGELIEAQAYLFGWLNNPKWNDKELLLANLTQEMPNLFVGALLAGRKDLCDPIFSLCFRTGTAASLQRFLFENDLNPDEGSKRISAELKQLESRKGYLPMAISLYRAIQSNDPNEVENSIKVLKDSKDGSNVLAVQTVIVCNDMDVLSTERLFPTLQMIRANAELPWEVDLQLVELLARKNQPIHAKFIFDHIKEKQPEHPAVLEWENRFQAQSDLELPSPTD